MSVARCLLDAHCGSGILAAWTFRCRIRMWHALRRICSTENAEVFGWSTLNLIYHCWIIIWMKDGDLGGWYSIITSQISFWLLLFRKSNASPLRLKCSEITLKFVFFLWKWNANWPQPFLLKSSLKCVSTCFSSSFPPWSSARGESRGKWSSSRAYSDMEFENL